MMLKEIIRYENAAAIEATWVDADGVVLRCHAYDATQMDELRADLGVDAPQHEALIQQCIADYVPPPPPARQVPQQITRAQGKAALIVQGLWASVLAHVAAIPDATQQALAEVALHDTLNWDRNSQFLTAAARGIGLSDDELDALFVQASEIAL